MLFEKCTRKQPIGSLLVYAFKHPRTIAKASTTLTPTAIEESTNQNSTHCIKKKIQIQAPTTTNKFIETERTITKYQQIRQQGRAH
jgi:hypothetical protein